MIQPELIQEPVSSKHLSSIFFDGLIAKGKTASGKDYVLRTEGSNEINLDGSYYSGAQVRKLGEQNEIDDRDVQFEVDVLVDNFLTIAAVLPDGSYEDVLDTGDENRIFNEYEEAIEAFQYFLNEN